MTNDLNNNYKINVVEKKHYVSIAKFFIRMKHCDYVIDQWLDKFSLFWELNPWFDEKKHNRGWIVVDGNNDVQGFIGSIPVMYSNEGLLEEAFWGTTWVVSQQARSQSLKLYQMFVQQKGVLFSTSTEPKIKEAIKYLFDYDELDSPWLQYKYTLPMSLTKSFAFISRYYINNKFKKIAIKSGNVFYKIKSAAYLYSHLFKVSNITINLCQRAPDDLDLFNEKFISKCKYTFPRNSRNIEWLYYTGMQSTSRLLFEVRDASSLIGLISFKCIYNKTILRLELMDFSLLYITSEIISEVIIQIQKILRKWDKNISFITFFSFDPIMDVELKKSGFHKMKSTDSFFIRTQPKHQKIKQFYTSPIDGDRPFFP